MGIFEEIERAWFVVENRLFLWNYNDGREFSRFDQMAGEIQVVGLVRARKDVFIDGITHLLIISTASRTKMLGLSQEDNGELSIYTTDFEVDSPAQFTEVQGTDDGRVFLLGHNRDIYELEYTANSGWFGNGTKMWITNRTSSVIANWVPSLFTPANREGIEKFVLDPQQNRLYTLQTNGTIEWFDVSGTKFESRGKYVHARSDLLRLNYGGPPPQHQAAKIVNIAPVRSNESKKVWIVAISANGSRLYLGAAGFYPGSSGMLSLIGHRPPPPACTKADANSFYSSGTMIAVKVEDTSKTIVSYVTTAAGRISSQRENAHTQPGQTMYSQPILQEWVESGTIPAQVWTIAEVTKTNPAFSPPALRRPDAVALSQLPREATVGARQFLILTNSGMFWALQPRPVDMYQDDIGVEKEEAAQTCGTAFGRIQVAAMCYQLAADTSGKQPEVASTAMNILLTCDPPVIQTSSNGARTISYSPRHDGYALSIARLLRPIWDNKVTVPAPKGMQKLAVPEKTLLEVQQNLAKLLKVVEDHPFPRHQADGDQRLAWEQEELSMHGLTTLLKQSIEAISFILLLADYKLPDVIAKCKPQTQQAMSSLTYQGLLTSQGGREIARQLVTALIELQIGAELSIDTLSSILQQRCGTFVEPGDVVLYRAEEALRRAENTRDPIERNEQLTESLRLFGRASESAARAVFPRLEDVTKRYRDLKDIRGAIELPLRVATEIDPNDKAGDYVRDGQHKDDPRREFMIQRQECYALVVLALGDYDAALSHAVAANRPDNAATIRDEAYALAIQSDDELFHFYLYDWIVEMGRPEQLLEFDTPFIEKYLHETFSTVPERRDLLWKFYARREEYLSAAKALQSLAMVQDGSDIKLEDRVYYLAQALTNAQSAACVGTEDVEFLTSLQERVDVAQVQLEVVRAIVAHTGMDDAEKVAPLEALNSALLTLDDLYQDFARPLRLFECILLILKTADTRVEEVCQAVWLELLRKEEGNIPALSKVITSLMRRFYPSEAAPLDIVLPLIYGLTSELHGEPGWTTRSLLAGGVGARELWDTIVALSEETDQREFYAEEAAVVLQQWVDGKCQLPPAEVEQYTTSYLLRHPKGGEKGHDQTRKTLQAAKNKASTY